MLNKNMRNFLIFLFLSCTLSHTSELTTDFASESTIESTSEETFDNKIRSQYIPECTPCNVISKEHHEDPLPLKNIPEQECICSQPVIITQQQKVPINRFPMLPDKHKNSSPREIEEFNIMERYKEEYQEYLLAIDEKKMRHTEARLSEQAEQKTIIMKEPKKRCFTVCSALTYLSCKEKSAACCSSISQCTCNSIHCIGNSCSKCGSALKVYPSKSAPCLGECCYATASCSCKTAQILTESTLTALKWSGKMALRFICSCR